jgi:acyl-CoA thioester hydrolase
MKNSTKIDIRIDWSEIDLFGHVNNLAIMKYVQAARVNMLEDLKLMQLQAEEKKGPILASIECQFLKPLFYPGQVTVYSNIGAIKNSSFQIHHSIINEDNELTAKAFDVIVFYDFIKNKKLQIYQELRERLDYYLDNP